MIIVASGTFSPTVGVEASLTSQASADEYVASFDLSNMVAADVLEIVVKKKSSSGGSHVEVERAVFTNAASRKIADIRVVAPYGMELCAKQTGGTARTYLWSLVQLHAVELAAMKTEVHLCKAALVNQQDHLRTARQRKIYDDDNSTVLKTLTTSAITGGKREG